MLSQIAPKFLKNIFFKSLLDHPSLVRSVTSIISGIQLANMTIFAPQIIEKALYFLTSKRKPDIQYKTKIECCVLLEIMAIQFMEIEEELIGSHHEKVLIVLLDCSRDKILMVQNAAKMALKKWN